MSVETAPANLKVSKRIRNYALKFQVDVVPAEQGALGLRSLSIIGRSYSWEINTIGHIPLNHRIKF